MPEIHRRKPYTPQIAIEFFDMCSRGFSLTQIASHQGILKQYYIQWSKESKNKPEFVNAWERGREAYQAFHESLLDQMIKGETKASAKEIDAQLYRLRVLFKEDWSEKQETQKVEVSYLNTLSTAELDAQILSHIRKLSKLRPELKVVNSKNEEE